MPHRLVRPERSIEISMSAGKVRTALSPSGALVRSALLSVSDGVVVLRPSGRIIDIDAHLRRRLGIAAAALSKRTLWSLVEPPHRSPLSAAWRTSKGGLAAFDAVPFSLPRGAVMTADLRFTRDDASGAVLCALHDVSAHRRDASSLAEQNREYEELLTRVPFALYKFRRTAQGENRLEYLSPRVAEMFGIDTAPLLSDVDRVVELVYEEDRAAFAQWITDPRWHDEDTSIEVRYGTPGGVRWIRLDASPHHRENGDIVWDGIAQDITERRVAEERLHQQTVESRFLADASAQLA
ncbi:MAG: PAS domain-containing protein, partial [Bacteroidetes bacterium]